MEESKQLPPISISDSPSKTINPALKKCRSVVQRMNNKCKWFNDPVHGNICMDELCTKIIDTIQFQRLRSLKQLGACDLFYPGATHTRFEHSLGVAYLAEKMAENLRNNQPELQISDIDVLCVKIAGLCHDLGHGPYCHMFDGMFMTAMNPNGTWKHEDGSVSMLEYLLSNNHIDVLEYGMTKRDLLFVKEIIRGTKESDRKGRPFEKFYLYDIVNNSRSGLDVDKLDYFERDMKYSSSSCCTLSFEPFILHGRVLQAEPIVLAKDGTEMNVTDHRTPFMICYPEKMVRDAVELFSVRFRLYQNVSKHKTVRKVEYMVTDVLKLADPFIRIKGTRTDEHPDGLYRISECYKDAEAFTDLQDDILSMIKRNDDPRLGPAHELLERIRNRKFYQCLGKTPYQRGSAIDKMTSEEITKKLVEIAENAKIKSMDSPIHHVDECPIDDDDDEEDIIHSQQSLNGCQTSKQVHKHHHHLELKMEEIITEDDIIVEKLSISYGMQDKNPVGNLRFFPKNCPIDYVAKPINEEMYATSLPRSFEDLAIRLFCKDDKKAKGARKVYEYWCRNNKQPKPFPSFPTAASVGNDLDSFNYEVVEDEL